MVFACQRDSYMTEFTSTVVSCHDSSLKAIVDGKSQKLKGFDVVLEDTILFPEGGGQPDDRGVINGIPVLRVTRKGADAIHFLQTPVDVGQVANMKIDWTRRFDHMQQHSGQHLITAIADQLYGYKTTSWNMGDKVSFIELDTPNVTIEEMDEVERICNEKIRKHLPVYVKVYEEGSQELSEQCLQSMQIRTRGLPDDHVGAIRVVVLEGIDENMCCGTHVENLSDLQAVKLLSVDKGKKGKTNLYFLIGTRILQYVTEAVKKDKRFTELLKGGSDQHVDLLDKMQKSLRISAKNENTFLKELATMEAQRFSMIQPRPSFFSLHKKDGNADFMSIIVNEIGDEEVLIFLTVGDEKGPGQILLSGKPNILADLGPKVMSLLDGKGAAKGTRFNGKVKNLSQLSKAESLLREELEAMTK